MPRERVIGPQSGGVEGPPLCIAHGCQMLGTWSPAPGGERVCYVHDEVKGADWSYATEQMHRLDVLFRLLGPMLNAPPGKAVADATLHGLRDHGFDEVADLYRGDVKTCRRFGYALRKWLLEQCKPVASKAHVEPDAEVAKASGLIPLGDLARHLRL